MNDSSRRRPTKLAGFETLGGEGELVLLEPAPRPWFSGPFPYHQPPCGFDDKQFLDRTELQPGHTFTESGRS
jgi:hypothetical protein